MVRICISRDQLCVNSFDFMENSVQQNNVTHYGFYPTNLVVHINRYGLEAYNVFIHTKNANLYQDENGSNVLLPYVSDRIRGGIVDHWFIFFREHV